MRASVQQAVEHGLPTVAECGGFLYLGQTLEDADGAVWPMAGVLPGSGFPVGRLVRFGYAELTACTDSLLFRAGESFPAHEFHHWDSTANGTALTAAKPMAAAGPAALPMNISMRVFRICTEQAPPAPAVRGSRCN